MNHKKCLAKLLDKLFNESDSQFEQTIDLSKTASNLLFSSYQDRCKL